MTNKPTTNGTPPAKGSKSSAHLTPHSTYYIRGGDLHFLLGTTLFRIHSHFFTRESALWRNELLSDPTSPTESTLKTGTSDNNAIVLEEKPEDFALFLWVFYNPKWGAFQRDISDWEKVLKFSRMWGFDEVKNLAIRSLEAKEMDPVQRIKLYQDNDFPRKYLLQYYMKLAERLEPPDIEESHALGLRTLVLIYQAREKLRGPRPAKGERFTSPVRADISPTDVLEIVADTFEIPASEREAIDLQANRQAIPPRMNASGRTSIPGQKK